MLRLLRGGARCLAGCSGSPRKRHITCLRWINSMRYSWFCLIEICNPAIQCLKRKRLYKQQVKQLGNFQLRIHDQDELEAELEDLEGAELEGELLKPVTAAPAPPVQNPSVRLPTQPMPQKSTSEDDELAAVQSEMAM
ncbi:hypothetical protein BHM03_00002706 [Ensete ventricosum]|nr:hypothetical protein BHM03_00002706 [Ensete ventricosum]